MEKSQYGRSVGSGEMYRKKLKCYNHDNFVKLLLAHLIGDFILQPKSWVDEKEKLKHRSPNFMYTHYCMDF